MSRPSLARALQPLRRSIHTSTALDTAPTPTPIASSSSSNTRTSAPLLTTPHLPAPLPFTTAPSPSPSPTPTPSSSSTPLTTPSALALIASQSTPSTGRYLLARLHARTYLLHPRDILTVPHLRPSPPPGTQLALTRILEVGSREYAIRAPAADGKAARRAYRLTPGAHTDAPQLVETVPGWVASCALTVLEHTKSPMERIVKKKRRKGYKKTIEHKQGWTRLRVGDIHLGDGRPVVPGEGEAGLA